MSKRQSTDVKGPAPADEATGKRRVVELSINGNQARRTGDLKALGGSQSDDFNEVLLDRTIKTAWYGHADEGAQTARTQASVGALEGIGPRDEIEGMLAAQMIATHNAAMECFRRAMIESQPLAGREQNLTQANKLTRSYATLVQALDKHRGKGQQTVRVEHVHVHSGGQAIVGNVAHGTAAVGQETAPSQIGVVRGAPMDLALADAADASASVLAFTGGSGRN